MLLILLIGACGKSSKKSTEPEVPVAPTPNSPQNALALLVYSWEQRSPAAYKTVFTEDYLFDFAPSDSMGAAVVDRTEELAVANNLFVTGRPGHPVATSIYFKLDPSLIVVADDRPGHLARWHKRITSNVRVNVNSTGPDYSVLDHAVFYVTRGDSAHIPADLIAAGATPDSTRWYVDHWTDDTFCPDTKSCSTIGKIKIAYADTTLAAERRR